MNHPVFSVQIYTPKVAKAPTKVSYAKLGEFESLGFFLVESS